MDSVKSVLEVEGRLSDVVQRETFLLEECETLNKKTKDGTASDEEKQPLQKWLNELEELNKEHWRLERRRHVLRT